MEIGFLHPGTMGVSLAATCREPAWWAREGRSTATIERAAHAGLSPVDTLSELVARSDMIVSIRPPAAAEQIADQVASASFHGFYVDANAIAPATSRRIAARFDRYVDGSVIGRPATRPGTTRLYLAGTEAETVAAFWNDSSLDARVLGGQVGAASALKMAYASWTKIGGALQLAIRALAQAEGIDEALVAEWNISQPGLAERSERVAAAVSPKAWRFIGEMDQISGAYADAGLPVDIATGAAEIYTRLADLRGSDSAGLAQAVAQLLGE